MRVRYDKEDDALMIWFSQEPIDHAEQNQEMIVHFSKRNKPVLIEVLKAAVFLQKTSKAFPPTLRQKALTS